MTHDAHGKAIIVKEIPESTTTVAEISAIAESCTHILLPSAAWLEMAGAKQFVWQERWIANRALDLLATTPQMTVAQARDAARVEFFAQ